MVIGTTDRNVAPMRRVGVLLLTLEVAVLVVTGVVLFFVYRPGYPTAQAVFARSILFNWFGNVTL